MCKKRTTGELGDLRLVGDEESVREAFRKSQKEEGDANTWEEIKETAGRHA